MHFLLFISISFVDSLMSFSKYPAIQKPHLFLRVEPVLTAFHDSESGIVLLCKIADGFKWRQVVTASIEDLRRRRPTDGMASHIAEVIPRQVLAERGMDGSLVNGATIYANDTVSISAYQSGPVKLTITYYAQNPDAFTAVEEGYSEEGYSEEGSYEEGAMDQAPIEPIGTAQYTIWFN
jgi:hypothetical protein